ncbi:MAG: SDR family oxidoreductase [Rhodoferax sp.]|nr:SDR family oxidoreductase [Rhodoferax sp.]
MLVTGGAKRLGRVVVQAFAEAGYACLVHVNQSVDEAAALCQQIQAQGGKAHYFQHEIANADRAANALLDACWQTFGVLPAASVLPASSYFRDTDAVPLEQQTGRQMDLNFHFPAAYCAALARRVAAEAKQPVVDRSVTLFTDFKVHKVNSDMFSYSLSKHALEGALPYLAVAFARQLRINAIAPGPILAAHGMEQQALERMVERDSISKKAPQAEDIGKTALFLASTPSLYGQHIFVDAGARFDASAGEYGVSV